TIFGSQEVWTDQQEDQVGSIQMRMAFAFPIGACTNLTFIPAHNELLSLQICEMFFDFLLPFFILLRVRVEDFNGICRCRYCCHGLYSLVGAGYTRFSFVCKR